MFDNKDLKKVFPPPRKKTKKKHYTPHKSIAEASRDLRDHRCWLLYHKSIHLQNRNNNNNSVFHTCRHRPISSAQVLKNDKHSNENTGLKTPPGVSRWVFRIVGSPGHKPNLVDEVFNLSSASRLYHSQKNPPNTATRWQLVPGAMLSSAPSMQPIAFRGFLQAGHKVHIRPLAWKAQDGVGGGAHTCLSEIVDFASASLLPFPFQVLAC